MLLKFFNLYLYAVKKHIQNNADTYPHTQLHIIHSQVFRIFTDTETLRNKIILHLF